MQKIPNTNREALARVLAQDCRTVEDIQEMIRELFKDTVEEVLEAEMDEHLGYEKHNVEGNKSGNSRNGYSKKTIKTNYGATELALPRDRNGEFDPRSLRNIKPQVMVLKNRLLLCMPKACPPGI